MNDRADAVIIGAGVIGAAIALELTRLGYATLSVDRLGAPGHGSTSASASIVRSYSSTFEMALLAWETIPTWLRWVDYLDSPDESGPARYVRTGSLVLESPTRDLNSLTAPLEKLGIAHELWSAADMADHLGHFDLHSFWPPRAPEDERFWAEPTTLLERALHVPEGGYLVDASLVAHNLAHAASEKGARFRWHADVVQIHRLYGAITGLTLSDGSRIDTPVLVNVAGPHSARINRMAGADQDMGVKTRPLRHELHVVPAPAGGSTTAGMCVSDGDLAINFRPEPGGHILVGSEDPDCDPVEWIDDADHFEPSASVKQWERQVLRLARRIPALRVPTRPRGLAGLYDVSDDWMPIYDRSAVAGFYMAVGSSGAQLKTAPTVGYLMSRLIEACEAGHDHDRDPLVVEGRNRGFGIDLGVFSRLRVPRLDAAFI